MKDEKDNLNYQYPRYKKAQEEFEIILVGINFLVVKNKDGNNLRIRNIDSSRPYNTGEKIYKEDGKFKWERA